MGLKSFAKKLGKDIVKSAFSPYNMVVPFVGGPATHLTQDHKDREAKKEEAEAEERAIASANAEFNENLEKRRKNNAYSKVIYAGILGDKRQIGLGGKKSLLGL